MNTFAFCIWHLHRICAGMKEASIPVEILLSVYDLYEVSAHSGERRQCWWRDCLADTVQIELHIRIDMQTLQEGQGLHYDRGMFSIWGLRMNSVQKGERGFHCDLRFVSLRYVNDTYQTHKPRPWLSKKEQWQSPKTKTNRTSNQTGHGHSRKSKARQWKTNFVRTCTKHESKKHGNLKGSRTFTKNQSQDSKKTKRVKDIHQKPKPRQQKTKKGQGHSPKAKAKTATHQNGPRAFTKNQSQESKKLNRKTN